MFTHPAFTRIPVGAELARDGGGSGGGDVEFADAFASKPAPTWVHVVTEKPCSPQILCGSGLARESGGSVSVMLDVPPSSRASSAPTGVQW
ncbi:hypothetical protein C0J56_10825 [Pseudomonas fluorescens]|nr:hypothetical protein C0J56_10825 [Pseudomonas fluorescens]